MEVCIVPNFEGKGGLGKRMSSVNTKSMQMGKEVVFFLFLVDLSLIVINVE